MTNVFRTSWLFTMNGKRSTSRESSSVTPTLLDQPSLPPLALGEIPRGRRTSRVDSFNTDGAKPKFRDDQHADTSWEILRNCSLSPEAFHERRLRAEYECSPGDSEKPLQRDVSTTGAGLHPSTLVAFTKLTRAAKLTTSHKPMGRSEEEFKTLSEAVVPTDIESQGIDAQKKHGPECHGIERQRLRHCRKNPFVDAVMNATFGVTNDIKYPNKSLVQRVRDGVDKARSFHNHRTRVRSRMKPK